MFAENLQHQVLHEYPGSILNWKRSRKLRRRAYKEKLPQYNVYVYIKTFNPRSVEYSASISL